MEGIITFFMHMTSWQWFSLSIALFSLELMFPGFFIIWFGVSALVTAVIVYFTQITGLAPLVCFAILGITLLVMKLRCRSCKST